MAGRTVSSALTTSLPAPTSIEIPVTLVKFRAPPGPTAVPPIVTVLVPAFLIVTVVVFGCERLILSAPDVPVTATIARSCLSSNRSNI
jgi:hypothetical protein